MNGMISTGRLDEFVNEVINIHNEEYKDKTLWEIWLHRVFDKSFAEFSQSLDDQNAEGLSEEELTNIVSETGSMLNSYSPDME